MTRSAAATVSVLLVDDRPENLLALRTILEQSSFRIVTAISGAAALKAVLQQEIDLILLDVRMPEMDGFEVAAHLKTAERTRHIPIIFLTATENDAKNLYRAYSIGAIDYMVKPLEPEIVRRKVDVLADLVRQRREIERQSELLRANERREYERQLDDLRLVSERRYRKLVEGIKHTIGWSADPGTLTFSFVSRQAQEVLGYPLEDFTAPGFFASRLHPEDRAVVLAHFRRVVDDGCDEVCDHRMIAADGRVLWFHTGASVERAVDGGIELHGISVDITELKVAERNLRFAADVGGAVTESLDAEQTLEKAASLLVPALADWCVVDAVNEEGADLQYVGAAHAHVDPIKGALLARLSAARGMERAIPVGPARAVVARAPVVERDIADPAWLADALNVRDVDLIDSLGAASCLFVPLIARGRVQAVFTLVGADAGRRFSPADVALAQDLCGRAALALDNIRLFREAEDARHAREEFLAAIAHDLKNPLSAIVTSAELIRDDDGGGRERARTRAQTILRGTERMERLIVDFQDMARLQAGRLPMKPETIDTAELIRDALELFAPVASDKSLRLEAATPDGIILRCDRDRTNQILSNLVGNAIKFTPAGGSVAIGTRAAHDEAIIAVSDSGPGIDGDELPHVFERFWQGKSRSELGAGLGLAIVKGLVEAHGGRVWVESQVGRGTTFYFTLPLAHPPLALPS